MVDRLQSRAKLASRINPGTAYSQALPPEDTKSVTECPVVIASGETISNDMQTLHRLCLNVIVGLIVTAACSWKGLYLLRTDLWPDLHTCLACAPIAQELIHLVLVCPVATICSQRHCSHAAAGQQHDEQQQSAAAEQPIKLVRGDSS